MRPFLGRRRPVVVALGVVLNGTVLALAACTPAPTAPTTVTVTSLSVIATSVAAGVPLRAGVGLLATSTTTLPSVVVAVRDPFGRVADFPAATNKTVGPTVTQLTSTRAFSTPGLYTYWVAINRNGGWTDLAPRKTFTVTLAPSPPTGSPTPGGPTPGSPTAPAGGSWKLSFADEFNGTALDGSRWATCYPRAGDLSCSNTGNGEAQWYKPGNVSVGGGVARLEARRETTTSPYTGKAYAYSSGLIQSKPGFDFRYGYMETRMQLPKGSGFWPAFWTWPTAESWPPEIDVMEFYGDNPRLLYQTLHGTCGTQVRPSATDWTGGWHTFAADWEPGSIRYYVDGQLTTTTTCAPDENMYLIANLAVANGANAPAPTASTVLPSSLSIDYIRVWQH
jgi:beta-glucanase (GH16 family)